MFLTKTTITLSILSLLLSQYISLSSYLFTFCSHINTHKNDKLFYKQLHNKCNDVFKLNADINTHHLYSVVIRYINEKFFPTEIPSDQYEWYINKFNTINNSNVVNIINQMELMKYAYVILYMIACFVILVILPQYIIDLLLFLCSKLLIFIYIILMIDFILYITHNKTSEFYEHMFNTFKLYIRDVINI